jgi:hypothetical protein
MRNALGLRRSALLLHELIARAGGAGGEETLYDQHAAQPAQDCPTCSVIVTFLANWDPDQDAQLSSSSSCGIVLAAATAEDAVAPVRRCASCRPSTCERCGAPMQRGALLALHCRSCLWNAWTPL